MDRRSFVLLAAGSAANITVGRTPVAASENSDFYGPATSDTKYSESSPQGSPDIDIGPLRALHTGAVWAEAPLYLSDWRCLIWSDIPNRRLLRWVEETGQVSTFASDTVVHGQARDNEGRLLRCDHEAGCIRRLEHDGRSTLIVDRYQGLRLDGPNDISVTPDGAYWFTDAGYGVAGYYQKGDAFFDQPVHGVYRLDPAKGTISRVVDSLERPNSVCFSRDFKTAYISDSGLTDDPRHASAIYAFAVVGARLERRRAFAHFSDGIVDACKTDKEGNVWCAHNWNTSMSNGIRVFSPDGSLLKIIDVSEPCTNICFGGKDGNTVFLTAGSSLYSANIKVTFRS
jgi:gluconolactonase